jgi:hypothetical protein
MEAALFHLPGMTPRSDSSLTVSFAMGSLSMDQVEAELPKLAMASNELH